MTKVFQNKINISVTYYIVHKTDERKNERSIAKKKAPWQSQAVSILCSLQIQYKT